MVRKDNDKTRNGRHPIQDVGRCEAAEFQLRRDFPNDTEAV